MIPSPTSRAVAYGGFCIVCALSIGGAVGAAVQRSAAAQRGDEALEAAYHSPTALAADLSGRFIYVADETASAVVRFDVRDDSTQTIALPGQPTGVALNKAADRLYVTGDSPDNVVWVVDLITGSVDGAIAVGHAPRSPVLSADESMLYVCNRFDNDVSVIDLKQRREVKRVSALREPIASALTPDGKTLIVGNDKPSGPSTAPRVASVVTLIDTTTNERVSDIQLLDGGVSVRGLAISPDGRYAFVSHILGRHHQPATQLNDGWLTTNAVSVIDIHDRTRLSTILLDQPGRGAANPWGVAVSEDGRKLSVSLAGVHELAVIDLPALLDHLRTLKDKAPSLDTSQAAPSQVYGAVGGPDTNLRFMQKYLVRRPLRGHGPRALVVRGGRAYVGMYFSGTVESVDVDDAPAESKVVTLGSQPAESEGRLGERLFNDGSMSFQGWLSCSTCHPEGRADGLNWDLSNDGIGNAKNVKSLLLSHKTPPVTWTGLFADLEDCVPFEIRTALFSARPARDAAAIVAYLSSLEPIPSPLLENENGELSESARRGQDMVQKAGCTECHRGEFFTIMGKRSVGVYTTGDPREFDIPTWREVWRTAPYLHDGRAATVKEIFTKFDPENRHGKHQQLSPQGLDDLVQFVLSQ